MGKGAVYTQVLAPSRGDGLGGKVKFVAVLLVLVGSLMLFPLTSEASAGTTTKSVRYGPFTIPGGSDSDPGMIHNRIFFGVRRPCTDCFITSFKPNLVYADGTTANLDTGPMLTTSSSRTSFGKTPPVAPNGWGLPGSASSLPGTNVRPSLCPPATDIEFVGTTRGTSWSTL